jgi:hypothetical protein
MMTVTNLQHDIYVVLALLLDRILWGKIPSSLQFLNWRETWYLQVRLFCR